MDLHTGNEWLEERTILLGLTGSKAYGTDTEESDTDYKGVCIPPVDYYLGLETFNEYNNSGGRNFKNTKDDVDVNILHLSKFVKDAMQGVPNNIELLFLRKEDFVTLTPIGERLVENRHLFLSKQIQRKFGGYAYSQMKKLENKKSNGSARQDLVDAHGYDTKFAMHSVRLLTSAIEILETGTFSTYRPNRDLLKSIRSGHYSFEEVMQMIKEYDALLNEAAEQSTLPKSPDYHAINTLLIELNAEGLHIPSLA